MVTQFATPSSGEAELLHARLMELFVMEMTVCRLHGRLADLVTQVTTTAFDQ